MINDERKPTQRTESELRELLNEEQELALKQVENFGWELKFIRTPVFQEWTVVIFNAEGDKVGVLEPDGSINMSPNIKVRKLQ